MTVYIRQLVMIFCLVSSLATRVSSQDESITYIMIDGFSTEVFTRLRSEGKLPNMDSLARTGLFTDSGIVSFPSMTGYSFYPFLTGVDVAQSGIFGLRWFDRSLDQGNLRNYVGRTNVYMNEDIRKDIPTIYELFPTDHTVSINSYLNRGVKQSIKKGWMLTTAKYGSDEHFGKLRQIPIIGRNISRNYSEHEKIITDLAISQLQDNPKVHWITYATPDASQHIVGLDATYDYQLILIDSLIGEYVSEYHMLGQEGRHIAIFSDHGVADVNNNIDPCQSISADLGLSLYRGESTELWKGRLDRPLKDIQNKDGYFAVNGNLAAFIYMTDQEKIFPDNWRKRSYDCTLSEYGDQGINLPQYLAGLQGVGLVIYSIDTTSHIIINGDSKAVIRFKDGLYSYECLTVRDPLGYLDDDASVGLVNTGYHTDEEWRVGTKATEYPDAFYRVHGLLQHHNSPDIVLCSDKGYDFGKDYEIFVDNYRGGHGGLHKSMLSVPFILNGPKVEHQIYSTLRSEELGQMILDLMGVPRSN